MLVLIFLSSFVPAVVPSHTGKSFVGGVDLYAISRRPAQLIKAESGRGVVALRDATARLQAWP